MEAVIQSKDINKRIDVFVMEQIDCSRTKIQKMIDENKILINGKSCKSGYRLKEGDSVTYEEYIEEEMNIEAENLPLDIVYEDSDVLVINKPNGMVVHPAPGNYSGTLVNALLYHSKELSDINGNFRPGIVHRIDAFTTGLLMIAKNNRAHEILAKQLEAKTTQRKYVALVWGVVNTDTGTIDAPIGRDPHDRKKMAVTDVNSKDAVTHFKVLERYANTTLIELELETGRTHQIRVHMNYIGYPVVNDSVYGHRKTIDETGQCLHAKELGFVHPTTEEKMFFTSELPECFINILKKCKENRLWKRKKGLY